MKRLLAIHSDGSMSAYNSISEASIDLVIPPVDVLTAINMNCETHGVVFSWVKDDKRGHHVNTNAKPVYQIDKTGKVIAEFTSVYQATILTGINNIRRCIRNNKLTAGGFYWRHKF